MFQISVSILVVLISCPALSLVCPVSLSDLPHGFPAYPWFLIGRPGCFVRDEFRCTTEVLCVQERNGKATARTMCKS